MTVQLGRGREQPERGQAEHGLARSGLAHQPDDLARGNLEGHASQRLHPVRWI